MNMNRFKRSLLLVGAAGFAVATASVPQAQAATFVINGDATNFAVLYEGTGGHHVQLNGGGGCGSSCTVKGNIGIGGTGLFSDSGMAVTGTVEFSAAQNVPTSQYGTPSGGGSVSGGATFNNTNVSTDLTALNNLSTTLGGETGTALTMSLGSNISTQTVMASSGTLDAMGDRVFTLSAFQAVNGSILTIQGDAAGDSVVFNINANASFGGAIDLSGLVADQVLFNIIGTGHSLQTASNGAILTGDFLDPNGTIQVNEATIDGRLFGGDSNDLQITSGGQVDAPLDATPLPAALPLFASGLGALGLFGWRRKRKNTAAIAAA